MNDGKHLHTKRTVPRRKSSSSLFDTDLTGSSSFPFLKPGGNPFTRSLSARLLFSEEEEVGDWGGASSHDETGSSHGEEDLSPTVLHCSEPQPLRSNVHESERDAQSRIADAVSAWSSGSGTESGDTSTPQLRPTRRRSRSFRKIKHRLSRTQSRDRLPTMNLIPTEKKPSTFSAKFTFQDTLMELVEADPRITPEIVLYYLHQKLPRGFPFCILQNFYEQLSTLKATQELLVERGWDLHIPEPENLSVPYYYFGAWSYDCWSVFDGQPVGSFITCHKPTRYYVMYKDVSGRILLDGMKKGPAIPSAQKTKLALTNGITRPPLRYECDTCGSHTPCDLLKRSDDHKNALRSFVITFPTTPLD